MDIHGGGWMKVLHRLGLCEQNWGDTGLTGSGSLSMGTLSALRLGDGNETMDSSRYDGMVGSLGWRVGGAWTEFRV